MSRTIVFACTIFFLQPSVAEAHGRAEPDTWWRAWDWDPIVLLICGLLAWLYWRGLERSCTHSGTRKVGRWSAAAFFGSLLVILIALLSPLDALSEELSSLHMVQHMLLTVVVAPMFVMGSPIFVLSWGLADLWKGKSRGIWRSSFRFLNCNFLWHPWIVWLLFAVTLWMWHHPTFYHAALRDPLIHDVQHISFFVVSCLYWRMVVGPLSDRRLNGPAVIPYLFSTCVHASTLGLFLALSPGIWYDDYLSRTSIWGLTPLEDQQLAGIIMWMPACLIYPAMSALLFGMWLRDFPDDEGRLTTRRRRRRRTRIGVTAQIASASSNSRLNENATCVQLIATCRETEGP